MRFSAADRVTAAHQWWKNGDHPGDNSEVHPEGFLTEGAVVRRYRHPDVPGTDIHPVCGAAFDAHGWIEDGDQMVCPGDWVLGKTKYRVVRANMHGLSYEPDVPGVANDVPVEHIADCRGCDVRLVDAPPTDADDHRVQTGHVLDVYDVEQAASA